MLKEFCAPARPAACRPTPSPPICTDAARSEVRGAIVTAFGAPPIDGLGTTGGFKLIVEDRGNLGLATCSGSATRSWTSGNKTPGLQGLFNSSRANTPWLYLDIDRTKCMALGVPVSELFNTLQVYLGSYYVNNFNEFGRSWQVNIQADQQFPRRRRRHPAAPGAQQPGADGPAGHACWTCATPAGRSSVMRYNMYAATAITGNPAPGTSSGQAIALMQEIADEELPRSMAYGLDRADLHATPGGQHGDCASSPWRWCSSSWCWRRSTKAGSCRWR